VLVLPEPPDPEWLEDLPADLAGFIVPFMHKVFTEPDSASVIAEMIAIGLEATPEVAVTQELELDWQRPARLLGRVTCPTLVIHGEADAAVPAALAESIVAALPNARLELIPAGGHRPDIAPRRSSTRSWWTSSSTRSGLRRKHSPPLPAPVPRLLSHALKPPETELLELNSRPERRDHGAQIESRPHIPGRAKNCIGNVCLSQPGAEGLVNCCRITRDELLMSNTNGQLPQLMTS